MNEQEKYLFDLNGYLVVQDALLPAHLAELNRLLGERLAAQTGDRSFSGGGDLLTWGQPFIELIDNPRITPYLELLLGDDFRLDHDYYHVHAPATGGTRPAHQLHGGGTPFDPGQFYRWDNGMPRCGLTVVAYNLNPVNPGDGGFAAVPGSHKSNVSLPREWLSLSNPAPVVQPVTGPAGSAVIFTEALTHGTLGWKGVHERRTIFYKYSPSEISWSARYYDPDKFPSLTERQRAILEAPNARYENRHG